MTLGQIEEILNATSAGWWEYSAVSNKVMINPGWLKMFGHEEDDREIDLNQWLRLVHPQDREQLSLKFSEYASQDNCFEIELRMLTNKSHYQWFSSRMKVVERDTENRPVRVVGVNVNIHERKRVEELENEVSKSALLVSGMMRISFSSTSIYDFLNQKVINSQWWVLQRLGYQPEEYEGVSERFFEKILHADDAWVIQNHIHKIKQAKKDEVVECVFRIRSKAGSYHWIALRDTILRWNKKGEVCQVIASIIDVTNYKSLKKQLDENLSLLNTLSFRNSHELRAPVATILGLVNLMRTELKTEGSVQEFVDILEQTITKMDNVIHEFAKALSK